MPKNIVICFDDRGNEFEHNNSNVVKLYQLLQEAPSQITYYHPGFGTIAKLFDASLKKLYDNAILPALIEMEFKPIYLDQDRRIGLIDNKIIAGIKESRFKIADYTLQRSGVYYEAVFAAGLGIPVIDCWRKDDFVNIHFDKKHHTILLWETTEDLKNQLINAIRANVF